MDRLKQRAASLVSGLIFLGFLWILFKKVIIVTWISMSWWQLLLLLVLLFFFIDTMVSRGFGAKDPLTRKKEQIGALGEKATDAGQATLDDIKRRLAERDRH